MLDVRYIAGFIDGEGCIYYQRIVPRRTSAFTGTVCVRMGNESKAIVEGICQLSKKDQAQLILENWEALKPRSGGGSHKDRVLGQSRIPKEISDRRRFIWKELKRLKKSYS